MRERQGRAVRGVGELLAECECGVSEAKAKGCLGKWLAKPEAAERASQKRSESAGWIRQRGSHWWHW